MAHRSPLRRPPRPVVWPGVGARPRMLLPSPSIDPDSSPISIVPASTSFLSAGCSMSCEDICPLFRGPRCNVLPRGKGMLRGFGVLLVTAGIEGSFSADALLPAGSRLGLAVAGLLRLHLGRALFLCGRLLLLAALFRLG